MAQVDGGPLKLLVVDDESDNLDLLYRTFRHEFRVFRANSAIGALELLDQEGEMAIIISDQRMPKMKGTELLSHTVERFPDTIRIVLTGYTDVEDLVEAINTGKVFKYITKPWNPIELKSVVQQAAETYRAIKRRTDELSRALRRESVFNVIMTAIRESLDFRQILETIVETLGKTFKTDACVLLPLNPQPATLEIALSMSDDHYTYQPSQRGVRSAEAQTISNASAPENLSPSLHVDIHDVLDVSKLTAVLQHRQTLLSSIEIAEQVFAQLTVPLMYQQEPLAILALVKAGSTEVWSSEDMHLISDVAEQAALAISQSCLYQQIQEQTEQMRSELAVARQIQTHLLGQNLPDIEGATIQAHCYPAREVGGDFFEVYSHPNGDVWLAVGDVSGKGVPAALFMASAISVLRRELSQERPPQPNEVLQNLNAHLLDSLVSSNCFITLAIARYNPSKRELVYANAGHTFPTIGANRAIAPMMTPSGMSPSDKSSILQTQWSEPTYLKVRGVPLGILPNWTAAAETLTLQSGDVFLLVSDGITEARVTADLLAAPSTFHEENQNHSTSNHSNHQEGHSGDRPLHPATDYQMLHQQGLWTLLLQNRQFPDLEAVLTKIRAHSLGQEDDQTILSMEIL